MPAAPDIKPLVISAPFGNYIQPAGATATLGTFTAAARPGRIWRILRTVRYYPRIRTWVNRIGLRNPGMPWLVERVKSGRVDVSDKIVSIHGFSDADWYALLEQMALPGVRPMAVELNMSCPNVGCIEWPLDLFSRALATGVPVSVKVPPVNYHEIFRGAWEAGVRWFHCCNTLPNPAGGLSGASLKPVSLQAIRDIRGGMSESERDELHIIGGGGILTPGDIELYAAAGAQRFAIATKVFNPKYLFSHAGVQPLIEAAKSHVRTPAPV